MAEDLDISPDDSIEDEFEAFIEGDCFMCNGCGSVVCNGWGCEGSGCPLCIDGESTCPECGGSGFLEDKPDESSE